jgi:hypothetical protein
MLGFYKNSISRIVVVWWATEMPDGENRFKSKKKIDDDGERESHGAARLRGPVINQSHHSPPSTAFFFFFLPPFLSSAGRESGRGKSDAKVFIFILFSFLTVIIATKLLCYSYSFVSLFFSFPLCLLSTASFDSLMETSHR